MCGVTWMDRNSKEYIRVSVENIAGKMKKNRLRWFGHIKRRNNNNIVKKID